jgi:membrane fusion protein (multidrug efflux system)
MNKWGTLVGLIILLAAALGVFLLFQGKRGESSDEPEEEIVTEVSVRVGKISHSALHGYILAYGRVELAAGSSDSPPARVRITAPAGGIISEVKCIEGQKVSRADTLFRLDSRIAEVAVKKSQQAVQFAEQNLARQKELIQSQGTSQKLLQQTEYELALAKDELTRTITELSLLQVTAPISGTIVRVLARHGEAVDMASTLAELINPEQLIIESRVPNCEVPVLEPGQKAEIETGIREGVSNTEMPEIAGELTFIDSVVEPDTDTVLVRTSLPAEAGLRPGQFVKVRFVYVEKSNCMVVPEESLVTTSEGQTVIAIVENDKAIQRVVQSGLRENGLVEVHGEGIREGMQVVTYGAYGLPPETKVRIITE